MLTSTLFSLCSRIRLVIIIDKNFIQYENCIDTFYDEFLCSVSNNLQSVYCSFIIEDKFSYKGIKKTKIDDEITEIWDIFAYSPLMFM